MEQETSVKKSLFEKIDTFIFQYIDQLKNQPFYIKILEFVHSVPRERRPWVQRLLVVVIFLVPFVLSAVVLWKNHTLKNDIEQKKEIYRLSKEILGQKRDIEEVKRELITPEPVRNKTDIDEKIRGILTRLKIPMQNISTKNFNLESAKAGPMMVSVILTFQKMTIIQFADFLSSLTIQEKMIVKEMDVAKNNTDGLLAGEIKVNLYSEEDSE